MSSEQVYGEKRRRLINSLRGRVALAAAAVLGALWLAFAGRVEGGDDPVLKEGKAEGSSESGDSGGGTTTTEEEQQTTTEEESTDDKTTTEETTTEETTTEEDTSTSTTESS